MKSRQHESGCVERLYTCTWRSQNVFLKKIGKKGGVTYLQMQIYQWQSGLLKNRKLLPDSKSPKTFEFWNFQTRRIFYGHDFGRIFWRFRENGLFSHYFLLIFKDGYIDRNEDLVETITHCKIQFFSKIQNFEIFRPVEYSTGMIFVEYSEDFRKIAYFHSIFYSSSKVDVSMGKGALWKP